MRTINAVIVGAQKAGTTSLNNYLTQHPDVLGHPLVEFSYFRDDSEYSKDYSSVFDKYFTKGRSDAKRVLAKNVGIYSSQTALERLYQHNPDCKLIYILREPVSRAISSYNMEVFNGWLKRDIEELKGILQRGETDDVMYRLFIGLGLYARHLRMMMRYFPKDRIRIYLFEDLKADPAPIYRDVCTWLGIDPDFHPDFQEKHNPTRRARSRMMSSMLMSLRRNHNPIKRAAKTILPYSTFTRLGTLLIDSNRSGKAPEPVSLEMRELLTEFFEPYNRELEEITGLDLGKWGRKELRRKRA